MAMALSPSLFFIFLAIARLEFWGFFIMFAGLLLFGFVEVFV